MRSAILSLSALFVWSGLLYAAPEQDARCELVEEGSGPAAALPLRVETVAAGLEVPWALAFLPGGDLLLTERPGRVRLIRGGALVAAPVYEPKAISRGEGGLLGLALHPRFRENRLFYLSATTE